MLRIFYSPQYVCSGYSFDTTRKAKWVADSVTDSSVHLMEPRPLTRAEILQVHASEYVEAVETGVPRRLAESQGFSWDAGLWPTVLASNGGAVAAARAAMEHGVAGSLSSGLHHARRHCGAGFCTFNGLVLAARDALASGARAVLILDLDAHCGGGTQSLIEDEPHLWQLDVSVNFFDGYTSSRQATLDLVADAAQYLSVIQQRLEEVPRKGTRFDLCLYNAGMDPHENCSTGGKCGITRDILAAREKMVFDWCRNERLPIAFVLAGGYVSPELDRSELVALHYLTIDAALSSVKRPL